VIDISRVASPFRFVKYSNYLLLVVGTSGLVGAVDSVFTSRFDFYSCVWGVVLSAFYGSCAWLGWKNIGVLESVVHRHTTLALQAVSLFSGALACFFGLSLSEADKTNKETSLLLLAGVLSLGLLSIGALAASLAVLRLRHLSIPELRLTLHAFLDRNTARNWDTPRLRPAKPVRGGLFFALGIMWMFGFLHVPLSVLSKFGAKMQDHLRQVGFLFLIYARQYFQPSFETLTREDQRAPVLFLRSFADDEKVDYQRSDGALFDFSLESRLAGHFNSIGPFIAVRSPNDKWPHLGAIRAELSDEEWQTTVVDWMSESKLIILMAGISQWITWELKKVVTLGHAGKLIIVFPQIRRSFWNRLFSTERTAASEQRLTAVREAFVGTIWEEGLAAIQWPERLRSISFAPSGMVNVVVSKPRNRDSYHLAALVALHLIRGWEGSTNAEPTYEVAPDVPGLLAGFGARAAAVTIDFLVVLGLYLAVFEPILPSERSLWLSTAVVLSLGIGYFWLCEALTGATPGKAIVGIRVLAMNGRRCGAGAALFRNVLRVVDGLALYLVGYLIAGSSPMRQRLGDRLAASKVARISTSQRVRVFLMILCLAVMIAGAFRFNENPQDIILLTEPLNPLPPEIPVTSNGYLRVGNLDFAEIRTGMLRSSTFQPGDTLLMRFVVAGVGRDKTGMGDITVMYRVLDSAGTELYSVSVGYDNSVEGSRRVHAQITLILTEFIMPGEYQINVLVTDSIRNAQLQFRPWFYVQRQ